MTIEIKHNFEREYGKKEGDKIFYSWENKHGLLGREHKALLNHPNMPKSWRDQERRQHHLTPFTPEWLKQEKKEGHPSIHMNRVNWNQWIKEEKKEKSHLR